MWKESCIYDAIYEVLLTTKLVIEFECLIFSAVFHYVVVISLQKLGKSNYQNG